MDNRVQVSMMRAEDILDIYEAFRKGMEAYFMLPEVPRRMRPRRGCTTARLVMALRPFFPRTVSVDADLSGADILVWDESGPILALFWSSSYLARERKAKAIAFHEKENPPLTLAFSLFPDKEKFLVYRIERGFIDYLHVDKNTFSEEVLRRCTIDEGKNDDGQLLLPLRQRRKRRPTSSQDR